MFDTNIVSTIIANNFGQYKGEDKVTGKRYALSSGDLIRFQYTGRESNGKKKHLKNRVILLSGIASNKTIAGVDLSLVGYSKSETVNPNSKKVSVLNNSRSLLNYFIENYVHNFFIANRQGVTKLERIIDFENSRLHFPMAYKFIQEVYWRNFSQGNIRKIENFTMYTNILAQTGKIEDTNDIEKLAKSFCMGLPIGGM